MYKDTLISVTTVVRDASDFIVAYVEDVAAILKTHYGYYELVLINNVSGDDTAQRIRGLQSKIRNIRLITLSRRYDDEVAYAAALDNCIGDVVVLMDANSDPPALIPKLVDRCLSGDNIVVAERSDRDRDPFFARIRSKFFYAVSKFLTGYAVNPAYSNYVAFSRQAVNSIRRIKERTRYLKYLMLEVGYLRASIPYVRIDRSGRRIRRSFWKDANFAVRVIVWHSERLMRAASLAALLVSFLNVLYGMYVLGVFIFKPDVAQGWTSSQFMVALMFFLLFLILAVIGEYLARILQETKKGDLYYVAEETDSTVLADDDNRKNIV